MNMFSYTNAIILGVISIIFILVYYQTVRTTTEDLALNTQCKESVKLNALTRYDEISADTSIKCPTIYKKVKATNQDAVFEVSARSLADTWNEFHEGRVQVFDTKKENFCVVRRVLEFSEQEQYKGFLDYLLQHNPPQIQKSYFSYLTNIEVEQGKRAFKDNTALYNSDTIDTKYPYAAIFTMSKATNIGKVSGAGIGAIVGVIAAGTITYFSAGTLSWTSIGIINMATVAGSTVSGFMLGNEYAADWNAGMLFIPYTNESLKSLNCTILPVAITQNLAQQ